MLANRLKNLLAVPRQTAKQLRRKLDEIAENLANTHASQPALNRVPVRSGTPPRFNNNSIIRHFSTVAVKSPLYGAGRYGTPSRQGSKLANSIWTQANFRSARSTRFGSRGVFPSSLYNHLPNARARMFSTYAASNNLTAEAVKNLTTAIRTLFNATEKLNQLDGGNGHTSNVLLNSANRNAKDTNVRTNSSLTSEFTHQTIMLARTESENCISTGCYAEFQFKLQLTIPTVTFLDENVMMNIAGDIEFYQREVALILEDLRRIENFGSLPIEFDYKNSRLKVYFPNSDKETVDRLLQDYEITSGVVYEDAAEKLELRVVEAETPSLATSSYLEVSSHSDGYYYSDVLSSPSERLSLESMTEAASSVSDTDSDLLSSDYLPFATGETPDVATVDEAEMAQMSLSSISHSSGGYHPNEVLVRTSGGAWVSV